jgi:exonuclease V gamma subunit
MYLFSNTFLRVCKQRLEFAMPAQIFFSNKYEELAESLGKKLFRPSLKPLIKKYVVVGGSSTKEWLMVHFANHPDLQMCANISFLSLEELASLFSVKKFPSKLEVYFAVLSEIALIKEEKPTLFAPVYAYLGETGKKAVSFALALSSNSSEYGLYPSEETSWQKELWKRVFEKRGWLYPLDLLDKGVSREEMEIHFFAVDYLPQVYCEFFAEASEKNSIHYYIHSPSEHYWGDTYSDRELKSLRRQFKKKGKSKEDIQKFEERNSFVGNFGKLQRDFLRYLDEYDLEVEERYIYPEGKQTLLKRIQMDLLELTFREQKEAACNHGSIEIHRAGNSKVRQLQILHDRLSDVSLQSKGSLKGSDILVLAPDISLLSPFIHLVFGQDKSPFDYKITHDSSSKEASFLNGLAQILALTEKEVDLEEVEEIWAHPHFMKKFDLSEDEVSLWREWALQSKSRFGLGSGSNSWHTALSRLIAGIVFESESSDFPGPVPGLDFSALKTLDKLVRFISLLKEDLSFLRKNLCFTLLEWGGHLERIAGNYFASKANGESYQDWQAFLYSLKKASHSFPTETFDFFSVSAALQKEIKKRKAQYHVNHQNAVRFSSLEEGSLKPCKIICLIDMQEGSFPRFSKADSLKDCHEHAPKRQTEDRFLFLKALLLAGEKLLILYNNLSAEDGRTIGPSLAVDELCTYLDRNFSIDDPIFQNHPILPFDPKLFDQKNRAIRSYHLGFYKGAVRANEKEKRETLGFTLPENNLKPFEGPLELSSLLKLTKDPWKFYLNQCLGIYLERNEREDFFNQEFFFSKLDEYFLRKDALKKPWKEVYHGMEKQGKLPLSLFGESAKNRLEKDFSSWEKSLKILGIVKSSIFSLSFRENVREKVEISDKAYALPPLLIPFSESLQAHLVGDIPYLCPQGLILLEEDNAEKAFENWPLILSYLSLPGEFLPQNPKIFFVKKNTAKEISTAEPKEALGRVIRYYQQCQKLLSPLRSDWIQGFVKSNSEVLEKKMRSTARQDLYRDWLLQRRELPDADTILSSWSSYFQDVFSSYLKLYGVESEESDEL